MLFSLWNGKETGFLFDNLRTIWLEETKEVRGFSNKQEKEKKTTRRNLVGNVSSLMCVHFKDLAKIFKNFHSFMLYIILKKRESVGFERTLLLK